MHPTDSNRLTFAFGFTFGAAVMASVCTFYSLHTWYEQLHKPEIIPPDWVFGAVWTMLYILMAISLFLVLKVGYIRKTVRHAAWVYWIQLFLNVLWCFLFFFEHNIAGALAEIVLLWGSILATILVFWRIVPIAGALLIPYLLWVTFASVLNFQILLLN